MNDNKQEEKQQEVNAVKSTEVTVEKGSKEFASAAPQVEGVVDAERVVAAVKAKQEQPSDEPPKFAFPNLFVDTEKLEEVIVEVVFDKDTGEVLTIARPGVINHALIPGLGYVSYVFKFRPVTYERLQTYRRATMFYDARSKDLVVNRFQLRSFLLINHLRETNLMGPDGKPVELQFDADNDNLNTESLRLLYRTVPTLMEVVLTLAEKKMMIVFNTEE
jgi:hypothetical protein